MPEVKKLPLMRHWTSTSNSLLVDDEPELHNIPFLPDIDEDFIEKLSRSYGGNIHGDNEADLMTDEIFVKLVEDLAVDKDSNGSASDAEQYCSQGNDRPFPSLNIFKDLNQYFPDMGSSHALKQR